VEDESGSEKIRVGVCVVHEKRKMVCFVRKKLDFVRKNLSQNGLFDESIIVCLNEPMTVLKRVTCVCRMVSFVFVRTD
jgi:hypothetical protein